MRLIDADAICKECIDEFLVATCENCVIKEYKINKSVDAVPVVRCKECKKRDQKKCPLVFIRFDIRRDGVIEEILEQNYVDENFWCADGERRDDNEFC